LTQIKSMVTANLNHERRPPSAIDDDDETNDRHIQTRLVSFSYYFLF